MFSTPFILTSSPGHLHKAPTDLPNHLWVLTCSCHLQNLYYSDPFLIFFLGRKSIFFFFPLHHPSGQPFAEEHFGRAQKLFHLLMDDAVSNFFFPSGEHLPGCPHHQHQNILRHPQLQGHPVDHRGSKRRRPQNWPWRHPGPRRWG